MVTQVIPFVSVIVPNYNHSNFLKKRIESILNQTFQNFELIILDDCSKDSSKDVIDNYTNHPKVSAIIFNDRNSGSTFKQWEKGISLAKGDYIWIAESDDYADVNFLEQVMKKFELDQEIGVVYCDSNVVREDATEFDFYKKYRNSNFKTTRWNNDYLTSGQDEINNYLIYDCTINNTSAMVFKRTLVDKYLFDNLNQFRYSGDWYFFLYITRNCKLSYVSSALNYFRIGSNNFAKGVKSPLNHFKERSLVRYVFLKDFSKTIYNPKKVFRQMGEEIKFKFFELIKNPSNFSEFFKACKKLIKTNRMFFLKQVRRSFS